MIPYLGLRATGIDPGLAAAAVACGRAPDVRRPTASSSAAVRFFYVARGRHRRSSRSRFDELGLPAAIDLAIAGGAARARSSRRRRKGTLLGRIAYATALAETMAEADEALDVAERALHVRARVPETMGAVA